MTSINPYLNFDGKTEEAFLFYKSVFGGEFTNLSKYSDMPPGTGVMNDADKNRVMHVSLPIGNTILMGSDCPPSMNVTVGNNVQISINLDSREETKRVFDALAIEGTIKMPLADAFWGAYFGMLTDKFGVNWMLNCENKTTPKMNPVVHFEMPYENKDRVVNFYTNVFGWNMKKFGPEMGDYVTAATTETDDKRMVKTPGAINGGFYPKSSAPIEPSVVIAVIDIQDAMKKITTAGGKIIGHPVEIPGVGQYVSFTDTEGNRVSILQPKRM